MTGTTVSPSAVPPRRSDFRLRALALVVLGVVALGGLTSWVPSRGVVAEVKVPRKTTDAGFSTLQSLSEESGKASGEELSISPENDSKDHQSVVARDQMNKAKNEIKARQYDQAISRLTEMHAAVQSYPEAYLLIGKALEGKKDFKTARDFYVAAIDRNPWLADAHWGVATTSESLGDLPAALGGMRSYLHTEPDPDPNRLKIAQARSAIWEWESQLGRYDWGPTKGIPPGFTRDELKRDGKGVAIKMQRPETLQPDGSMKYDIRHADKVKIFPR